MVVKSSIIRLQCDAVHKLSKGRNTGESELFIARSVGPAGEMLRRYTATPIILELYIVDHKSILGINSAVS
jgi:hypothetical protein